MVKFMKYAVGIAAVFAALVGAAIFLMVFWDRLMAWAVAGKEMLDTILKGLLPDKLEKDDKADYYDI